MSGFLNLSEDCEEAQDTLQEKKDLQTFLKSILGEKLATEQYSNIVRSAQKATEAIGWEILLRLDVKDKVVSDKIYELLAPKFAELKKLVRYQEEGVSKAARVIIILIVCSLIFPSCGKTLQRACEYINQIVQPPEFAETVDAIVAAIFSACVKMYDAFVA